MFEFSALIPGTSRHLLPCVARTDALQTLTNNKSPLMAAYLQAGLGPLDPPLSVPATAQVRCRSPRSRIDLSTPCRRGPAGGIARHPVTQPSRGSERGRAAV